jgi:hypothetical protein
VCVPINQYWTKLASSFGFPAPFYPSLLTVLLLLPRPRRLFISHPFSLAAAVENTPYCDLGKTILDTRIKRKEIPRIKLYISSILFFPLFYISIDNAIICAKIFLPLSPGQTAIYTWVYYILYIPAPIYVCNMLDVAYYIYPNLGDICSANAQKQKKKRICSSSWGFCQQLFSILLWDVLCWGIVFFSCVCGLDKRWRINKITDPFSPLERICWSSYNNNQRDFWAV